MFYSWKYKTINDYHGNAISSQILTLKSAIIGGQMGYVHCTFEVAPQEKKWWFWGHWRFGSPAATKAYENRFWRCSATNVSIVFTYTSIFLKEVTPKLKFSILLVCEDGTKTSFKIVMVSEFLSISSQPITILVEQDYISNNLTHFLPLQQLVDISWFQIRTTPNVLAIELFLILSNVPKFLYDQLLMILRVQLPSDISRY